jgi:hypothetical protein
MRIACVLIATVLAACGGGKLVPAAAPSAVAPDATPNAAPPLRDESPAPPATAPVPILAPPS